MHKNSNCKQCYEFGSCYVSFNIIFISLSAHPPPYNITAAWWRLQSLHRLADIPLSDIWHNLPAMACNHTATNLDLWFFKLLQLCIIPHYSSRWHSLQEAFIQVIKDHSLPPQAHTTCLFSCTHLNTQSPALLSLEYLHLQQHSLCTCLWNHIIIITMWAESASDHIHRNTTAIIFF